MDIQPIEVIRLAVVLPGWCLSLWLALSCVGTPAQLPYARGTLRYFVVRLYVLLQCILLLAQTIFLAYSLATLWIPPDTASYPTQPIHWIVAAMTILVPACLTATAGIVAWARYRAQSLA